MLPFFVQENFEGHTVYRHGLLSQTHGASRLKRLLHLEIIKQLACLQKCFN